MTAALQQPGAPEPIAVVGLGCRFPGAPDPAAFWDLLREGRNAVGEVPADRWDADAFYDPDMLAPGKMATRWGGFVERIYDFDAQFFGISPREAAWMDPQQRLLLEVTWEAFEDAGVSVSELAGSNVGVFVGLSTSDFSRTPIEPGSIDPYVVTGNAGSIAANRISYLFDFRGPSMVVDTACSSALVALHLACQSLWSGESSLAISGGVNIILAPEITIAFTKAGMMSADGRCKAFDAAADGYVRSEGAGAIILKPLAVALADDDDIYACILGSAVNQDGRSNGLTAPNAAAQEAVIRQAAARAGIDPGRIDYVEAHGTGTPLGDPLEAKALAAAIANDRAAGRPLLVGSLKTNIGHMEAAAGIGGLVKVCLALKSGKIPATLHFERPNPLIPMADLGLRVPTELTPWPRLGDGPAVAGVSSFGFGGTNAHVILAESPVGRPEPPAPDNGERQLVPLSARSEESLKGLVTALADSPPDATLADLGWSAATRRSHHEYRAAFVASSTTELAEQLSSFARGSAAGEFASRALPGRPPRTVFVCAGQGPQWFAMGRKLLERESAFRDTVRRCDALLAQHGELSLLDELAASEANSRLDQTVIAQPALFAVELGLAELWRSWGLQPDAVVGHSLGEVSAAVIAGALTLEDAVQVIVQRSRLMQTLTGLGRMAVIALPAAELDHILDPYREHLGIAAINTPDSAVVAGATAPLQELVASLVARDVRATFLPVNYAFHSPQVLPLERDLIEALDGIEPRTGSIPFVSTVTGERADGRELGGRYWGANLRGPVLFADAIEGLVADGHDTFVELSPQSVLTTSVSRILRLHERDGLAVCSLRRGIDERAVLLEAAARLYSRGWTPRWSRIVQPSRRLVKLPRYRWTRKEAKPSVATRRGDGLAAAAGTKTGAHPLLKRHLAAAHAVWEGTLSAEAPAFLADHRVGGNTLVPGTVYLEIALAGLPEARAAHDVEFVRPLAVGADGARRFQLLLAPVAAGETRFEIFSDEGAGNGSAAWTLHATGVLTSADGSTTLAAETPAEIRGRCPIAVPCERFYEEVARRGLEYGPSFKGLHELWVGEGEALGRVVVPPELEGELDRYRLHPAVLDACGQVVLATLLDSGATYLPTGIDSARLHAPLAREMWVHARLRPRIDETALVVESDGRLLREDGVTLVEVRGARLQRASRTESDEGPDPDEWLYELRWDELPPPSACDALSGTWLVAGAGDGLGAALGERLRAAGAYVTSFEEVPIGAPAPRGVVTFAEPGQEAEASTVAVAELVRAIVARAWTTPPRLWIVTRGTQAVAPDDVVDGGAVDHAALWGLGRVLANEHPELQPVLVDLGRDDAPIDALTLELATADGEAQIALRGSRRYGARLARRPEPDDGQALAVPAGSFRLEAPASGIIDELSLRPARRVAPTGHQVEIEVHAAGLNFRDVMKTLGIYPSAPGYPTWLGDECSGVVTAVGPDAVGVAPGDEVVAIAPLSFSAHVLTRSAFVAPKPRELTFAQAAGIPIAFLTAYYSLAHLARLERGERVLIHAAAGGVGLAAVQVAHWLGAEVLATAGSPEKRNLLRELGVSTVMDSRTLDFASEVMMHTGGVGVDVVLNSLSGEALERSLTVLAPFGRFIEIGKRDIFQNRRVGLAPFRENGSFIAVDMELVFRQRHDLAHGLLREVMELIENGTFQPLPTSVTPLSDAARAMTLMAQGRHTGKVVLEVSAVAGATDATSAIRPDATYLITGGLGALGLEVARWLVDQQARWLVLSGRHGASRAAAVAIEALERSGATVRVLAADVAQRDDVDRLLAEIGSSMPPLRGVVHAAGVLDDGLLTDLSPERFGAVIAPKVRGAWNLHHATTRAELDFFVLFSSVVGILGSPGQANYAAANSALDALAHHRRGRGLAATSIDWGPWGEVGMARRGQAASSVVLDALGALAPSDALELLGRIRARGLTQSIVLSVDWKAWFGRFPDTRRHSLLREQAVAVDRPPADAAGAGGRAALLAAAPADREALLVGHLGEEFARVLQLDPARIEFDRPLNSLGVDSLMGIELKNKVDRAFGVTLPMVALVQGPTITEMAALTLRLVEDSERTEVAEREQAAQLLEGIDELTDAEVDSLLEERLPATEPDRPAS